MNNFLDKIKNYLINYQTIILYVLLFLLTLITMLFAGGNRVFAKAVETELEVYEPSTYNDIPQEYRELYTLDKYDWYKVEAEYWLVYHEKHDVNFWDTITNNYQAECEGSGYNQNHTYAFTRFTKADGSLIDGITYLEYRYTNEKGVSDNYWQEVNILPNGNTEYDYDGTFLSMNNVVGFDNGNGEIVNGALIPGMTNDYKFYDMVQFGSCKIAYSQKDLKELEFDDYNNESDNLKMKDYEECNYLMYWPTQCIKELAYINIWWVEEKVNTDGSIEILDNRGTLSNNGTAVGIDPNGNVGVYSVGKVLLDGYKIREDGIIINPDGTPTISWDDQMKGAVLVVVNNDDSWIDNIKNPMDALNDWWNGFTDDATSWWDKILGSLKRVGILTGCVVAGVLVIWLITKIVKWIKDARR